MYSEEPRSILLSRASRDGGGRRSPGVVRRVVAAAVVLVFVAAVPRSADAGFLALLAQMKPYLNTLIDQWEKYSRILEDHMDSVAGVMQPFSDIHAGVEELMDTRGLRGLYRLGDSYRATLTDPSCYRFPVPASCTAFADFTPPELRELYYTGVYAVEDGARTYRQFEEDVYGDGALYTVPSVQEVLRVVGSAAAADPAAVEAAQRAEAAVNRNRWQLRRMRSLADRGSYLARQFLFRSDDGPDDCPTESPVTSTGAVNRDATFLDQAVGADCLSSRANAGSPLEQQAHLSSMESATLQAGSLISVVDMRMLELERLATGLAAELDAEEQAEAARRRRLERAANVLACGEHAAYADGGGGCLPVMDADTMQARADALLRRSFQ